MFFPGARRILIVAEAGKLGRGSLTVLPPSILNPCMRLACIQRILYSTISIIIINFFFFKIFFVHIQTQIIFDKKYQNTKTFFLLFSYKFTVKHRVKTSHKIIIMMHYHYNIMIVRTKQNDNFSLLISALQTYDQKYYENLTSYKTASIKFLWVVHVLQQNKTPKNLLVFEKAYIHHH